VELLGRPFAEPRLFELAYAFERATDHRRPPEAFTP
jgi:Asp-tRNA(Asn)/Glu-tRNA(Gln) amidotransferase A subunit family amidase